MGSGYLGGSRLSRKARMSRKSASARSNTFGEFSGLIMNCISDRTERASPPPV
jgi:hypothetical protein